MSPKPTRGGARRGAGRPPLPPSERKRQLTIRLSQDQIEFLKSIDLNLSEAVRKLIEPRI